MPKTILLTCGDAPPRHLFAHPLLRHRLHAMDVYELERAALSGYAGLLIPTHADQRFLSAVQDKLQQFLACDKAIVFCGQITYPFLPGVGSFVPVTSRSVDDYRVCRVSEHLVFADVDTDHLTFRKGIAGFYGRGHMPPPPGAHIIHRLGGPDGPPIDYDYLPEHGGRVLIHAGNDLWNYATETESSAHRIPAQLLDWIESAAGADNEGQSQCRT
jgi:hypothetical protein